MKANKTYTKNQFTTPVYSANPYKEIHRAVMHPEAAKYMITNFSSEGQTILDPFMGVGTTGIVCNELNRSFTGIELDKDYFDICKNKLN